MIVMKPSIQTDRYTYVFTNHLIDPEGLLLKIIPPIAFVSYVCIGKGCKSPGRAYKAAYTWQPSSDQLTTSNGYNLPNSRPILFFMTLYGFTDSRITVINYAWYPAGVCCSGNAAVNSSRLSKSSTIVAITLPPVCGLFRLVYRCKLCSRSPHEHFNQPLFSNPSP